MPLVLLIGGARSGKSSLALRLAQRQDAPVVFLATAEPRDEEMAERIGRHRDERPAEWKTLEEPVRVREALESVDPAACVIVDCLTLWTSNALERDPGTVVKEAERAAKAARSRSGMTIAITNEVGLGIVPANELARTYRDVHGRVNAIWAAAAEAVYLVVAGKALELRDLP